MDKAALLARVIKQLRAELELLARAAEDARQGATDSEVRSESKYDTRGLESSYLARGHAIKFEALAADVATLEALDGTPFAERTTIGVGALVSVETNGEAFWYFLLPKGGGTELDAEEGGPEVTIVTPESPMGQQLSGLKRGDRFTLRPNLPPSEVVAVK